MKYSALIPVKSLTTAKSRLAPSLTQQQRETLVLDMLHHVLCALQGSELFDHVTVVSSDERVLELSHLWGARAVSEEQHGHNPALHAAALREYAEGVTALLTISADLPLLSIRDIRCMFEQSKQHEIVLAPSREGTGTNAILVRPPLAVPYVFGPDSFHNYIEAARQKHRSYTTYHSTGLALDIDTIDDLNEMEVHNRSMKEIIFGH